MTAFMRRMCTCAAAAVLLLCAVGPAQQQPVGVLGIYFEQRQKVPGVVLTHVIAGSPAWVAGLRGGDVVVLVGGVPATPESMNALQPREPGQKVDVIYLRSGKRFNVSLTREERGAVYERAAALNDAIAQMALAELALEANDNVAGCRWARRAAETGNAHGQTYLGWCYSQGVTPLPKDLAQATYWTRRAADQGHSQAQFRLAIAYRNGDGVQRDDNESVRLARASANQGHVGGFSLLGDAYRDGRVVARDVHEAARWYARALHLSPSPELREYIDKSVASLIASGQLTRAQFESLYFQEGERKRTADDAAKLRTGSLHLASRPAKARVYVDGALRGTTSEADGELLLEGLSPGAHTVRVAADGYKDWEHFLVVSTGMVQVLDVSLERAGPRPLGVAEVEDALRNGISSTRVAEMVRQYGVDFALTDDIERRLRAAGADDSLLLAIAKARRS